MMEKVKLYSRVHKKYGFMLKKEYDQLNKKDQYQNVLVRFSDYDRLVQLCDLRVCYELNSKFVNTDLTPLDVISTICRHMNVDFSNIYKSGRKKEIVRVRHYLHFFLRKFVRSFSDFRADGNNKQITFFEVVSVTGCVSHATVIHSIRQLKKWYQTELLLRTEMDFLHNELIKLNNKKNESKSN